MRDISLKPIVFRSARASARLYCSMETLKKIERNELPKEGSPFDIARAAVFLGTKKTSELIPHCHPIPIEGLEIQFTTHIDEGSDVAYLSVDVRAHCHARTGIEMEVLHGASLAVLVLYDLLKPLKDQSLYIGEIRLLEKHKGRQEAEQKSPI